MEENDRRRYGKYAEELVLERDCQEVTVGEHWWKEDNRQ